MAGKRQLDADEQAFFTELLREVKVIAELIEKLKRRLEQRLEQKPRQ